MRFACAQKKRHENKKNGAEPFGIREKGFPPNNGGGGKDLIDDRGDEDLTVEVNKRRAAKNLIRSNGDGRNLIDDRSVKDLKAAVSREDAAKNLLEPVDDVGGENLLIGNGDEDMKVEVDRGDSMQLNLWKAMQKRKKRKNKHPTASDLNIVYL